MNASAALQMARYSLGLVLGAWLLSGCADLGKSDPTAASTPGAATYVWSKTLEAKRLALESATAGSGISVRRTKDNQLQMNVPSDFSFDFGSAAIKPGMRPVLDQFAHDLEATALSSMLILVVGHTDDRGPDAINDSLSLARADNVRKYLESKGIAAARISVEGRGEHEPAIGNEMSITRALNRRIEVYLREPRT